MFSSSTAALIEPYSLHAFMNRLPISQIFPFYAFAIRGIGSIWGKCIFSVVGIHLNYHVYSWFMNRVMKLNAKKVWLESRTSSPRSTEQQFHTRYVLYRENALTQHWATYMFIFWPKLRLSTDLLMTKKSHLQYDISFQSNWLLFLVKSASVV